MTARTTPDEEGAGSFRAGGEDEVYDDGHLRVEHNNYYVACRAGRMRLTRLEFLLLSRLVRSPDRVVKSEELWEYAWGEARPYNPGSLHVHMYRLRKQCGPSGVRIRSMPHVGYSISPGRCRQD
ncbi:MAG: helix-turn-helix domain-containing protein [Acidobacteria bacterium]|nr:helix-turn-helix domain-containing protein [Acidobacteriota bacterium]MCA1621515.1 helix-turn-helix domain-containing protein [Acidobacteriota bacterium]